MQRQIQQLSLVLLAAAALAGCEKKGASATAPQGGLEVAQSKGDEFAVSASVDGDVAAGAPAQLVTKVEAKKGYHINAEYPVNFRPEKVEGIAFDQERYPLAESAERVPCGQGSQDACELRAKVPFTPQTAGEHSVKGILAFSVCTDEKCLIEKAPIEVKVSAR